MNLVCYGVDFLTHAGLTPEKMAWMGNCIPFFYMDVDTYSCLKLDAGFATQTLLVKGPLTGIAYALITGLSDVRSIYISIYQRHIYLAT